MNVKERIAFLFEDTQTFWGRSVDIYLLIINLIACVTIVLDSISAYASHNRLFDIIEIITVTLFSAEYILRYWVAPKKLKYVFSLMSFIDLIAILPSFFAFGDFRFLRILRVFRIFRFTRFFENHVFFFGTINKLHLHIARIIFTIFAIIFVASGLIYNIEGENIGSYFDAIYFSLVTITTVGFGDITPETFYGKLTTLFIILLGIILVPWQIGNLLRESLLSHKKHEVCSHCGLSKHDHDAIHCKHCGSIIYQENGGFIG